MKRIAFLLALASLLLASCGGGGGSSAPNLPPNSTGVVLAWDLGTWDGVDWQ